MSLSSVDDSEEPQACVKFDEMYARIEAITTIEEVSEDEFKEADSKPNKLVRNPHKVFDIENVEYLAMETDGKPTIEKVTNHDDKKTDFLRWYNKSGSKEMLAAGQSCANEYQMQIRKSSSQHYQMAVKARMVYFAMYQASSIAADALEESLKSLLQVNSDSIMEIERLKNRYNKLAAWTNEYGKAVAS